MSGNTPSIGIDFGTTNSSMAWYDPRRGQAEVIKNQGEDKTPSMVHFGEGETLVGKPVDDLLEDVSLDRSRREEFFRRTVMSIKRNLIAPPRIALPGDRCVRPVDVAAEIIKNLKREAEESHFHEEILRAVITCPAEFNVIQRRKIEDAGRLAGFEEVALIEEPAAAALAYARSGLNVGDHVLVYDLGGGTFDLAVLENEEESFHVALEPKGIDRCGGDDFDLALYYHCEEVAWKELGRSISLDGRADLKFLRLCRRRKENLSWQERSKFSNYLSSDNGPVRFEHEVDRRTLEELIDPYVEETILQTRQMLDDASARGFEPDTAVLIGGSTRVPLVEQRLAEALPIAPLKFDRVDVAVALGAAYYADVLWPPQPKPVPPAPPAVSTPQDRYHRAVKTVSGERMDRGQINGLNDLANQLGLSEEQRAEIERQVLSATIGEIHERQREEYREAVEEAWKDRKLSRAEVDRLGAFANDLGLEEEAAGIEREVLGATREEILPQQYHEAVRAARAHLDALANELGLSRKRSAEIEREGLSKDWSAVDQYRDTVKNFYARAWDGTEEAKNRLSRFASDLGLRRDQAASIEREVIDDVGETVFAKTEQDRYGSSRPLNPEGPPRKPKPEKISQALFALSRTLTEHSKVVHSVAISPDGQLFASAGTDNKVYLWDIRGELIRELVKQAWAISRREIHSVAFGPNGAFLASGDASGTTRLWDPRTGELIGTLGGQIGEVRSIAFSPDGRLLASGSGPCINLWDTRTKELDRTLGDRWGQLGFGEGIFSVAFSQDGGLLASGGRGGSIKLWEARTGRLLRTLGGNSGAVTSLAISPYGRILASGNNDLTVEVWDLETGNLLHGLDHSRTLSVAMSSDGRFLFSGGDDGKIKVWNPDSGELLDTLSGHSKGVNSVAVSPDGRFLVSGGVDKTVRIWERATNER
jgi:WD40 repeat protein